MTRRILFVDDEPMVLRGLQRGLHGMRAEWDMRFVESGAAALEALDGDAFDAVVSDMRMPQMNGAELLNEVMRRHPALVRIVLSGHADRDLILQCVGSAHQFLAKPSEPEVLKAAIQRAFQRSGSAELDRMRTLLTKVPDLPVLPASYRELQRLLEEPEAPLAALAMVIQGDIGLTAKVLKLTNSAFFGLRRTVTTVPEAIHFLGLETIKALVLLKGFMDQIPGRLPGRLSVEGLAENSLQVAGVARAIAHAEIAATADMAFAAGLLHKTGLLLLGAALPGPVEELLERLEEPASPSLWELEREAFGVDHAQVGGYLLGLWGLPEPMIEAVRHYPCPSETPPVFSAATAVHGACAALSASPGFAEPLWRLAWDLGHLGTLDTRVPPDAWGQVHAGLGAP